MKKPASATGQGASSLLYRMRDGNPIPGKGRAFATRHYVAVAARTTIRLFHLQFGLRFVSCFCLVSRRSVPLGGRGNVGNVSL